MTKPITEQERYAFRDALIADGVPEEIAVIASERWEWKNKMLERSYGKIAAGFNWAETPEGDDFWLAVCEELEALEQP